MICGMLCSGKSTYAERLKKDGNSVLLSVDELMLGVLEEDLGNMHDKYVQRTKSYLLKKSLEILDTGADILLDWGFWSRSERDGIKEFYAERNVASELHYINVSNDEWLQRIEYRNAKVKSGEISAYFVDDGLLKKFEDMFEAPNENEIDVYI